MTRVALEPGPYATEIFGKNQPPADQARVADYGSLAEVPAKVYTALSSSPANAQEVADAVVALVEMPPGKRPLRTLIGPVVTALQPLNDTAERLQREILESFGMVHLLALVTAGGHTACSHESGLQTPH